MKLEIEYPQEAGCYIDGHNGQYAAAELVRQFSANAEAAEAAWQYIDSSGEIGDFEEIIWDADDVEEAWNKALESTTLIAGWFDGEFFVIEMEDAEDW